VDCISVCVCVLVSRHVLLVLMRSSGCVVSPVGSSLKYKSVYTRKYYLETK